MTDYEIQEKCRELVKLHVHGEISKLVSYFCTNQHLLDVSDYSYDGDILPLLAKYEYLEEAHSNGFSGNTEDEAREFCLRNNIEPRRIEAQEHWLVSDWLAYHLKNHGEIVGSLFDLTIWGRTTTGEAVYMDYIIEKIYTETQTKQRELALA